MSQKATYEIIITEKLNQLPVPDLQELIWSRIEQELDEDPGFDDDNDEDPAPSGPLPGSVWGGSLLLCCVAAAWFFFSNNKQQNTSHIPVREQPGKPVIIPKPGAAAPGAGAPLSPPVPQVSVSPGKDFSDSTVPYPQQLLLAPADTPVAPGVRLPPPAAITVNPPATGNSKDKDSLPPPKRRGVTGITDSDYRIVPKKDSGQ